MAVDKDMTWLPCQWNYTIMVRINSAWPTGAHYLTSYVKPSTHSLLCWAKYKLGLGIRKLLKIIQVLGASNSNKILYFTDVSD